MTETKVTLWQVIGAIASQMPLTPKKVESVLGVALLEHDRRTNFVQLKGVGPRLDGNTKVTTVGMLTRPNLEFDEKCGLSLELEGACITLDELRKHYGDLQLTQHPRGRSLQETTVYSSKMGWGTLSFGFREEKPNCLFRVTFRKN